MNSWPPPAYRTWHHFGWRSPHILYKRLGHAHPVLRHPLFTLKMKRQRMQRGWSDADVWGFNSFLAVVIADGIAHMREIAHGHPAEITFEAWIQILQEIEDGMRAAIRADETGEFAEGDEEKFKLAFAHMQKWWYGLWD